MDAFGYIFVKLSYESDRQKNSWSYWFLPVELNQLLLNIYKDLLVVNKTLI